ncbi:glutamine synthetase [Bodo saltans virus]|jgi:glutamine synthetase|uniref:glutamine synthetase n=1 Tax=Bodo saltans virus TaxID=2024608 RepID=A0A2H4UVS5_9VIRU|nr:glutamine synthetase [Bodo saltans virus]ATZ80977.1 glutamine synthetase [Bodo saltans virus]
MIAHTIAEYVWIDATGGLRSKTRVFNNCTTLDTVLNTDWNFDGSSTGQAYGRSSDVILHPVRGFNDPFRRDFKNATAFLIMCETLNPDKTPHRTNFRKLCMNACNKTKNFEPWFGMEQEYILMNLFKKNTEIPTYSQPFGWSHQLCPNMIVDSQSTNIYVGDEILSTTYSYCSNGGDRAFGRNIVEKHFEYCLYAGIKICGINAEVTPSQWEFQIGICDADEIGDHLWMARYILSRVAEEFGAFVDFGAKPLGTNWNGSGCHTNFSTNTMRDGTEIERINAITEACDCMSVSDFHQLHLNEYGDETNKNRLTGKHETASYEKFTYGYSDRGCSVRIPVDKTYLEDRRPAANCDPYKVVTRMLNTIVLHEK